MKIEEKIEYICKYVSFDKDELLVHKGSLRVEIEWLYDSLVRLKTSL